MEEPISQNQIVDKQEEEPISQYQIVDKQEEEPIEYEPIREALDNTERENHNIEEEN